MAESERDGSLVEALSRVLEAGQNVVVDRVELALAHARSALQEWSAGATLAGFAVLFLLLPAWLALLAFAALWLGARWSLEASLATLGLVQLAIGAGLLSWVARRRSGAPLRREIP